MTEQAKLSARANNFGRYRRLFSIFLLGLLGWQWGHAGWIYAKAELAQVLIQSAWQDTLLTGKPHRPWPWADTTPVARLVMPEQAVDLYILDGADGTALAFGPGHVTDTALPGLGTSVVGGHRDTHFSFLQHLNIDETFNLQDQLGRWHHYQVTALDIFNSEDPPPQLATDQPYLVLITCYPFKALQPGGPLRYVVSAAPVNSADENINVADRGTNRGTWAF